jgi:hypothetical protein
MSYFVSFADLLLQRSGGKINLFTEPQFKKIAAFQQQCYFPGGAVLYFSDASEGENFRLGLSSYLAERSDTQVPSDPYKGTLTTAKGLLDHCGRFAPALRDLVWTRENIPLTDGEPHVTVFPDAEWLLCTGAGETGFAAKGGHNGESHNHNDVGNFIFYKKGRMAICDLGAGEYTKDYFGDKRYDIFCNKSEGHNVPIINGQGQQPGREFAARDCRISPDGSMTLDMAGAYTIPELLHLERKFNFNTRTGVLLLKDTFSFEKNPLPVTERFVTQFKPGELCTIKSRLSPVISEVEHRDHEGKLVTVYTIDFSFVPDDKVSSIEFEIK